MDDIQLVASVAAGDLLGFRDSVSEWQLSFCSTGHFYAGESNSPLIVNVNPGIFLSSDWVYPAQLRVFLAGRDVSTSTCQSTISVKLEPSQACLHPSPRTTCQDSKPMIRV
ncbi:hypothetical protein B0H14DRAFT_2629116 [Mycena olivaceomarginata]|nr:hypothetical protein B0H14DRAFT_2629116 [Mycena olivaceomarginata]